jgi:hypothetical protein
MTDDPTTTTDEPTANDHAEGSTDDPHGTRGLLKAAGAAVVGAVGLGALGDTARAAASRDHVVVVGYGQGRHTYEITTESGGTIEKAPLADPPDSTGASQYFGEEATGELWHWNADSFAYTGEIQSVTGQGTLGFHFGDGAFGSEATVFVRGNGSGTNRYSLTTPRGDIDTGRWAEHPDSDDGVPLGDGERDWTQDRVSGAVEDGYWDSYELEGDTAVQTAAVRGGAVTFY